MNILTSVCKHYTNKKKYNKNTSFSNKEIVARYEITDYKRKTTLRENNVKLYELHKEN